MFRTEHHFGRWAAVPFVLKGELHDAVLAVGLDITVTTTSYILTLIRRGSTEVMLAKILRQIGAELPALLR